MVKRQTQNMIIVFLSTALSLILFITGYVGIWPVMILLMGFNIIFLIYYRDSWLKNAYHITMMLYISGYFGYFYQLIHHQDVLVLFRAFIDFGSMALIIISFVITFTDRTHKIVNSLYVFIAVWAMTFYSNFTFQHIYYLTAFFGPSYSNVAAAIQIFQIIGLVLWGSLSLIYAYMIYHSDQLLQKKHANQQKQIEQINQIYY